MTISRDDLKQLVVGLLRNEMPVPKPVRLLGVSLWPAQRGLARPGEFASFTDRRRYFRGSKRVQTSPSSMQSEIVAIDARVGAAGSRRPSMPRGRTGSTTFPHPVPIGRPAAAAKRDIDAALPPD
jgi:hypothetical protein